MESEFSSITTYEYENGDIVLTRIPCPGSSPPLTAVNPADDNVWRTMLRQEHKMTLYGFEYNFDYFVTLSFNKHRSLKKLKLANMVTDWLRTRPTVPNEELRYLLTCLPTPSNPRIWHIHALIGGIASSEFTPLQDCPRSLTKDAKARIARGATPLGWRAFEKAFRSIAYVEKFGDYDEKGDIINQRGKALYLAKQLFYEKKVGVDASGNDIMVRDKDASIKAYKANFAPRSHPYRTAGIHVPDEKGTCKVQTETFKNLLEEYPDADVFSRTVVIPAKDAEAFRETLREHAMDFPIERTPRSLLTIARETHRRR